MVLPSMVASKRASRSVTAATTRSPRELLAKKTWVAEAVKVLGEAGLDGARLPKKAAAFFARDQDRPVS